MLLDEDPATLIHHTIGNFNITPDKLAVSRINESLSTLQQARELRVREADSALKKLSRTLTTLNNHHNETLSSHSSTAHASEIATLDTQKFRIAKTANDLEIESERLSSQLADLQSRLQELEQQGVEGGDNVRRGLVDDEIGLKLKVYRGLGIDIERDSEGGEYNKAIVRNGKLGDVHIVNMDGKFSRFFYANYFWNTL
ncbi:putative kinetochore protein spc24 [Lachnellula arida]|uniref:Kinetochore protein Spc24 n=1 Tax=Lachnellula arida TaxID=1316785 RepID=A0A8T9B7P7_9HELO|nr:putative kinetochore protein spc24 [Lachnellula arida]